MEKLEAGNQNGYAAQNNNDDDRSRSSSRSRSKASKRPRPRRRSTGDDGDIEDYDRHAKKSRAVIARLYEDGVRQLGDRYAQGDAIGENRMQAQVRINL